MRPASPLKTAPAKLLPDGPPPAGAPAAAPRRRVSEISTIFGLELEPLPRGRGLAHALVTEHQRDRLMTALVDLLAEQRIESVSLAVLARRARVSLTALYEVFEGKDAYATATMERFVEGILAAMEVGDETRAATLGAHASRLISSYFVAMQEESVVARACVNDLAGFCPGTRDAWRRMTATITQALDAAFGAASVRTGDRGRLPEGTHWNIVEAMHVAIREGLDAPRPELAALAPPTVAWVLAIYRGCGVDPETPLPRAGVASSGAVGPRMRTASAQPVGS